MTGPNFLIIGAQKAGTTALWHHVRQHPDVFMPSVKEPGYFLYKDRTPKFLGPGDHETSTMRQIVTTLDEYEALFKDTEDRIARGEASADYLANSTAISNIRSYNPDMKLIVIIRSPLERAYSNYCSMVYQGREDLPFNQALFKEVERVSSHWSHSWEYRQKGYYAQHLNRLRDFIDKGNLLYIPYEEWKLTPYSTLYRVFEFLEVNPTFKPEIEVINKTYSFRNPQLAELMKDSRVKSIIKKVLPKGFRQKLAAKVYRNNLVGKESLSQEDRKYLFELYFEVQTQRLERFLEETGLSTSKLAHWRL